MDYKRDGEMANNKHMQIYTHYQPFSQLSHSVMSDSLWPHESKHARPPCPSPTSRVHSDSRPSSQWCHPAISSSVVPFSSCPQSFPASGSFQMSQLCTSGSQSIGVSASIPVLPMNTQDWSPKTVVGIILSLDLGRIAVLRQRSFSPKNSHS